VWALSDFRTVFVAVVLIGVLVCWVPSVMLFARLPGGEKFSELYYLGPGHMAEGYPYNVRENVSYLVYLGVGNHMGDSVFYEVCVKFRNSSESLPNATSGEASSLPVLFVYRVFLGDGGVWEGALNFSLLNVGSDGNVSSVGRLDVNGLVSDVNKVESWDNASSSFAYQVFVELWRYDVAASSFRFDNRFVTLWLNVTQSF
jgi:hypothetical protein